MSEIADLARAIDRLAQAIEQGTLEMMDRGVETTMLRVADDPPLPEPPIEEFPAFQAQPAAKAPSGTCPTHHEPWKYVPPGVSKSSGKPYEGFWACPERGCRERPR